MKARISVVVPATSEERLKNLIRSLSRQTFKPCEIIMVIKGVNVSDVEELCRAYSLNCIIIEQKKCFVTHALNIGKKIAQGDVVIFTDDDAIALPKWLERYVKLHRLYGVKVGCVSSRDIYVNMETFKIMTTPDDMLYVKLYRYLVRPLLELPHPLLKRYRLGVYITRSFKIAVGPCIPNRTCFSLPFRGVNMSFKREALDDIVFPEHPLLRRYLGWEQYVGLQLVLRGWDCIYVSDNPILHIVRRNLSRVSKSDRREILREYEVMRALYKKLLDKCAHEVKRKTD